MLKEINIWVYNGQLCIIIDRWYKGPMLYAHDIQLPNGKIMEKVPVEFVSHISEFDVALTRRNHDKIS